jgi:hypothetical protein
MEEQMDDESTSSVSTLDADPESQVCTEGDGADYVDPRDPFGVASTQGPHHEHTAFGDYEVYPDAYPASLSPASDAIHESEFHTLETAWNNIHHGTGLDIQGSAADKATFDSMLANGLQHSEAFRQTMEGIGTDAAHTEHVNLGHSQANTFGDSFATNDIDLSDMSQFPAQPRAGHRNEATQTELLDHILDERHYAQTHDPNDFGAAHKHALDSQNQVRDELGQSHVTSQSGTMNADGTMTADFHYANGDDELIDVDNHTDITNITPPADH